VKINEAEALACLGQWQAALDHVAVESPNVFTTAGLSAHRAWVLAELGRLDEARVELARGKPHLGVLGAFRAEWHFSRFAIEFAARDWSQANLALLEAEMYAARETTRRNLHFLRGRLACARGDDQEALKHFGRGSQSVYRWQGGAALLEWGDALARLGRREDARVVWNECLIRDPQSPAAELARSRLDNG
jgi:tetratricopeptide (TPR) repeat protein